MNPYGNPFDIQEVRECGAGGYLITFPDLPSCVAVAATVPETVELGYDLARVWLKEASRYGCVPLPSYTFYYPC